MLLQPKTAIAFRSEEECKVLQQALYKQGFNVNFLNGQSNGRAYICPEAYRKGWQKHEHVEWSHHPEDFKSDKNDPFEWEYLEAADVLRNLIIAERKKNAT